MKQEAVRLPKVPILARAYFPCEEGHQTRLQELRAGGGNPAYGCADQVDDLVAADHRESPPTTQPIACEASLVPSPLRLGDLWANNASDIYPLNLSSPRGRCFAKS